MSSAPLASVLFVCVHNAGRSQMAAGFLHHLAGDRIEVRSAGSVPGDQVNPAAVEAMKEVGIDISAATPKILTTEAVQASDYVITMGCGDACPIFPGKKYLDWALEDPAGKGVESVRPIRDEIRTRIEALIAEIDAQRGEHRAAGATPPGSSARTGRRLPAARFGYGGAPQSPAGSRGRRPGPAQVVPAWTIQVVGRLDAGRPDDADPAAERIGTAIGGIGRRPPRPSRQARRRSGPQAGRTWVTRHRRRGSSPSSNDWTSSSCQPSASASTRRRGKKCTAKPPCSKMSSPWAVPRP